MAASRVNRVLLGAALGLVALGIGAVLALSGRRPSPVGNQALAPTPVAVPDAPSEPGEATEVRLQTVADELPAGPVDTTVLWPLRVELDLVRAAYLAVGPGLRPVGSDRCARIAGRIAGADDKPVRATVRFLAGPNSGRTLLCDSTGSFGATDLYPGRDVVEVDGPGIVGSRREVLLRQGAETLLNIGYGRLASAWGRVVDKDGNPIDGAEILLDGQRAFSDPEGYFFVPSAASGRTWIEIRKAGYAAVLEERGLTAGHTVEKGRADFQFVLRPSASLEVVVRGDVGSPGPVDLVLLPPADNPAGRRFPWFSINPVRATPGVPVRIDDLPPGVVSVRAFRAGARGPRSQNVALRSGTTSTLEIPLEPAPALIVRVRQDGQPAARARVVLEAIDRVNATLAYVAEPSDFLEYEVMPQLAPAVQTGTTDEEGLFVFTAWSDVAPIRHLEATGADGRGWAARLVKAEEKEVLLELESSERGGASLRLVLTARYQGLPVEVLINGAPRDPLVLPPERDLVIEDLLEGTWSLRASWHGDPVYDEAEIDVAGDRAFRNVDLPPAAIEGQDEEAWLRAGRR